MKATFSKPCRQLVQSEGHEGCDGVYGMHVIHEIQVESSISYSNCSTMNYLQLLRLSFGLHSLAH